MRTAFTFTSVVLLLLTAASCSIPDDERCGPNEIYKWDVCIPVDTDTDTGTGDDGDGGPDSGLPTGMGEPCTDDDDCAAYEADYCAYDPFTETGICTIADCITDPDSCPTGWKCCDFPDTYPVPDFCMSEDDWEEQHAEGHCQ